MAIVCGFLIVLFAIALYSFRPRGAELPASREVLDIVTLSVRYRPMLRLLNGSDFELVNDAGDPKLLSRIRSQRRSIFRGYLRSLRRDHAKLCSQMRTLILESDTDRGDVTSALGRMETTFQFLLFLMSFRLAMHAIGGGSVTAEPLMKCLEQLRIQAELLASPLPAAAAA